MRRLISLIASFDELNYYKRLENSLIKKVLQNQKCHPEFISGSLLKLFPYRKKILKRVQNDTICGFVKPFVSIVIIAAALFIALPVSAQQKEKTNEYEFSFAPDLWFNSVDGIRAGVRMRGQRPGSFKEGPHRLDAGLWLSTFFPDHPVSYFVSFTEPIPSISGFNSEGNIRLRTSIRTGYHKHGLSFNKRWQPGFDEKNYQELSLSLRAEKRFDDEYLLYPQIWQNEWLYLGGIKFLLNNNNPLGRYRLQSKTSVNLAGEFDSFINTQLILQQKVPLGAGFALSGRLFAGLSSNNTAPEYLFSHSSKPYAEWDEQGTTRAKGTLPTPWVEQGIIQVSGGANLRGYTNQDIEQLNNGGAPLFNSLGAFNAELEYPNPVNNALKEIPVAGLFDFSSYLFFDTGTSLGVADREEERVLSDFGPGFKLSLNIPDYLGKPRGFAIRYEIPLWLSHPGGDNPSFKFRSLIGIGAVISL